MLHTARWKCKTQKIAKNSPSGHHRTTLSGYIFASKAYINNRNSYISPTCAHNMANYGLLAAEICRRAWGTPPNFNGFRVLTALLHDTRVVGVSQFAAFNRGRHLHSAGQHVSVCLSVCLSVCALTVAFLDRFSPKVAQRTQSPTVRTKSLHGFNI